MKPVPTQYVSAKFDGKAQTSSTVALPTGVNVHAKQRVDGRDRKQLERLCRYVTRPPLSQERLERRPDGSIELVLKHAWRNGTRAVVLEPDDLMVRLVVCPCTKDVGV